MVMVLLERERPSTKIASSAEVSTWVLSTFNADLKGTHPTEKVAWLLTFA
jgi:hypothetical protein